MRILERDGRIDPATAEALRANAWKHSSKGAAVVIGMDEQATLASALAKCPHQDLLPLEQQLELAHEDHRRELLERQNRKPTGQFDPEGMDRIHDWCYGLKIKELEEKIRSEGEAA